MLAHLMKLMNPLLQVPTHGGGNSPKPSQFSQKRTEPGDGGLNYINKDKKFKLTNCGGYGALGITPTNTRDVISKKLEHQQGLYISKGARTVDPTSRGALEVHKHRIH